MSKRTAPTEKKDFQKKLPALLEEYLESCRPPPDTDPKRSVGRLPNLAGFCRYLGIGITDLRRLRDVNPPLFDRLTAVLEDELLNHSPSPTILSAYLKKRLGYAEDESGEERDVICRQMHLIFEHDIEEDGA